MDRLEQAERNDIHAWFATEFPHGLVRASTACSGTDSPVLVWEALISVMNSRFGLRIRQSALFACESNKKKRDFSKGDVPSSITPTAHLR